MPVDSEETIEAAAPSIYFEQCPNCGAEGGSKFCSECGHNMELEVERPSLNMDKILIAEDSAATRLALSILVRRLGFTPLEAYNGSEALRLAKKEMPGMILMDV